MKIFDRFFFLGILLTFLGLAAMFFGLILVISGSWNILFGSCITLAGALATRYGRQLAKNEVPGGSRTAIETLRRAKLINLNNKR